MTEASSAPTEVAGPVGTGAMTVGNHFYGAIGQNFRHAKRWGKVRKANRANMARLRRMVASLQAPSVWRFQSLAKYDNNGYSSIPLWATGTQDTWSDKVELDGGKLVAKYDTIWLPYYVFNLTSRPVARDSGLPGGQDIVYTYPFYQLGRNTVNSAYTWRACCGMNNKQYGNFLGGASTGATLTHDSFTYNYEDDKAAQSEEECYSWDHVYSHVKLMINGVQNRPTTIRTGVISFVEPSAAPIRYTVPTIDIADPVAGDDAVAATAFDTEENDYAIRDKITDFWDSYWTTKIGHPLNTHKRFTNEKVIKYHKFDRFVIGNDSTVNKAREPLRVFKDYVIGSLGHFIAMDPSPYVGKEYLLNDGIQNETIQSAILTASTTAATVTNNDVKITSLTANGQYPAVTSTSPVTDITAGAMFPQLRYHEYNSPFPERDRDRWFFIQADYYNPSEITNYSGGPFTDGLGVKFPQDVGVPGSNANWFNMVKKTFGHSGVSYMYEAPPSFDFVVQTKFIQNRKL